MAKQLFTLRDFSGSLNLDADPSDMADNDCLLLENLVPFNQGLLKLDRPRVITDVIRSKALTAAAGGGLGFTSWRDSADNLVIVFLYDVDGTNVYIGYAHAGGAFGSNDPTVVAGVLINAGGGGPANIHGTKNSFIVNNGILHCGAGDVKTIITNFTVNTVVGATWSRNRFGPNNTGYVLSGFYQGGGTGTTGVAQTPTVVKCDTNGNYGAGAAITWAETTVGIYAAEAAAGSTSYYVAGDKIKYGISYEYDFMQETPMQVLGSAEQYHVTIATTGRPIDLKVFVSDGKSANGRAEIPYRVTGFNVYRSVNDGEFFHLYRIDIETQTSLDDGTLVEWSVAANNAIGIILNDYGFMRTETYSSRTGNTGYQVKASAANAAGTTVIPDPNCALYWHIGCMFRGMAVVSCRSYKQMNDVHYPRKRIYVSKTNQVEMFDPQHYFEFGQSESSFFQAIAPLGGDRICFWDKRYLYVVNARSSDKLSWYIENTFQLGDGTTGDNWCEVPNGIAFANNKGFYIIDAQGKLTEGSRKFRSDFANIDVSTMRFYYDWRTNLLLIANTGRTDSSAAQYTWEGYQLDFERQAWSYWSDDAVEDVLKNTEGIVAGFEGETHLLWVDHANNLLKIYDLTDVTNNPDTTFRSKFYDMGDSETEKTGKHIFIKYKSGDTITVNAYVDGDTATAISLGTLAVASSVTVAKLDFSRRFRTLAIELTSTTHATVYELYEIGVEYKPRRPRG